MRVPPLERPPASVVFCRDGTRLHGVVAGSGQPVLVMHGLGASTDQAEELVTPIGGARWLLPDSRGHGASEPGRTRPFSIPLLAADALAFAQACGAPTVVAGGISLGAAMALHLAVRHRPSVRALLLVRPAWLFEPAPPSLDWFGTLARALRTAPIGEARRAFAADPAFCAMARRAPAHAGSLLRWFDHPDPTAAADLLEGVLTQDPGVTAAEAAGLDVPSLVLGAEDEHPHPLATARALAEVLPRSRLLVVPSRGPDKAAFLRTAQAAIAEFLAGLPDE